jgi:anhydro-N-acetylmuramic acid kinase
MTAISRQHMQPVRAVGLISGTSMDGIDAAAVEIADGVPLQVELRSFHTLPYPAEIRTALLAVCENGEGSALDACRLAMVLGELFAQAAQSAIADAGWQPHEVSLIGSHGQTTVSDMTDGTLAGYRAYSTLQLANPAVIAERTGITVVADFRARDIAAGGRGAPLVPLVDALLYARPGHARALLNLGGIANLTLLPATTDATSIVGFDTGPANMPLDTVMRHTSGGAETFDRDGLHAARGHVDPALLRRLRARPFFQREPPKATGSEEFGDAFVASLLADDPATARDDLLATLVQLAADTIADGLRRWFPNGETPQDVLVSGGGTHNRALMGALTRTLAPIPLRTLDEVGGHADAKEAMAFAVLGYLTLRGRAGTLSSVTGAAHPAVLGSVTPGAPGIDLLAALDVS